MKCYNFFGDLDDRRTYDIVKFLFQCKKDDEEAVILINSGGGNSYDMALLYETLRDIKVQLTTIGIGRVSSAAASLFAMGDDRILLPGTRYLVHSCRDYWEKVTFTKHGYQEAIKKVERLDEIYVKMFAKTKITNEIFEEKCGDGSDWILTPEELKKYEVTTKEEYEGWTDLLLQSIKED